MKKEKFERKLKELVEKAYVGGIAGFNIDRALITTGLKTWMDEQDIKDGGPILLKLSDNGGFSMEWAQDGYEIVPKQPEKADFRPVEPPLADPVPEDPPEIVSTPVAAIRWILGDLSVSTDLEHIRESLKVIDGMLDKMTVVTDPDIPDYLRTLATGARRLAQPDTARTLDAAAEQIERGLHARSIDTLDALREFYLDVFGRNVKAGWWNDLSNDEPKKRNVGELFMLFVTEIAEAYDAYVEGAADDKLPEFPGLGVELGDLQIRLADFCGALMSGKIVHYSGARNPGESMFREVCVIARRYEAIRKTPNADGAPELGAFLEPQDVPAMTMAKLAFNAHRPDHKIENRKAEGGKRT